MTKKLSSLKMTALGLILTMLVAILPADVFAATPNWKTLYQSKVKQIENEYRQKKRKTHDFYENKLYSLIDIDFDGIPELYHCLVGKNKEGYELYDGSEEIYYIKSNKVTKGKIQGSDNCGLIPCYEPTGSLSDAAWQNAMYDGSNGQTMIVTHSTVEDDYGSKKSAFNKLSFNCDTGVLNVNVLHSEEYFSYAPEFEELFSYENMGNASTYSIGKNVNSELWKWEPIFIITEDDGSSSEGTVAPKLSWSDEYKNFLTSRSFSNGTHRYYSEIDIEFFMNDMDADGIPELIIQNGTKDKSKAQVHFYSFADNKIVYAGTASGYSETFKYMNSTSYPGIFTTFSIGGGTQNAYYYTLEDGELVEELVYVREITYENGSFDQKMVPATSDNSLYRACQSATEQIKLSKLKVASTGTWNTLVNEAIKNAVSIFRDVPSNNWAYDAVKYVSDRNLMSGVSADAFEPNGQITRAQFITVLYRLDGMPKTKASNFSDVPKGSWYEAAVSWATAKGIASGVSKKEFAPNQVINREQLTTILYRYAKYKKKTVTADDDILLGFVDNNTVSSYAKDSVGWAIQNGIISGTDSIHISPFAEASRAQVAVILQRFCEKYKL